MKSLKILGLITTLAAPVAVSAQAGSQVSVTCDAGATGAAREAPNLHGHWDFVMVPGGQPSFGLMSIGFVGADYGGTLAPSRTAPVVIRRITLASDTIRMEVASREGDVLFDGKISPKGDLMCGTVTYHGGQTFPMVAQKRPMAYQSPSQVSRQR